MDISSVNSDLIRGNVTTIILGSLWSQDRYGYDILKEIETKSEGQYKLKQPTLYNQLKRLEKQGLISSYDGDPDDTGGGRRRYYSLTAEGRNFLQKEKTEYEYSRTILDRLVSAQQFDFDKNPAPFNAEELRPYTKKEPSDKAKVVYKEKEVEKVVLVEKKVFLDANGNEITEEEAARLAQETAQLQEAVAQSSAEQEAVKQEFERLTAEKEEQLRLLEEQRAAAEENLAEAQRLAEERRLEAERAAEEHRAETERIAEERRAEAEKFEEEKQAELERIAEERRLEIERIEAEHKAEIERIKAEKAAAEEEFAMKQAQLEAEKQSQNEAFEAGRKAAEEKLAEEQERLERLRKEEEIRRVRSEIEVEERKRQLEASEAEERAAREQLEKEREMFREEVRAEIERRAEEARKVRAEQEEKARIIREREEAMRSQATLSLDDVFKALDAESEYAMRDSEDDRYIVRDASWQLTLTRHEEPVHVPEAQPVVQTSEAVAEESASSTAALPDEKTQTSAEEEQSVRDTDTNGEENSAEGVTLSDIFASLDAQSEYGNTAAASAGYDTEGATWYVEDRRTVTEQQPVTAQQYVAEEEHERVLDEALAQQLKRIDEERRAEIERLAAELEEMKAKLNASESRRESVVTETVSTRTGTYVPAEIIEESAATTEYAEAEYVADTEPVRGTPETTLRDVFRRLDEREAEIDAANEETTRVETRTVDEEIHQPDYGVAQSAQAEDYVNDSTLQPDEGLTRIVPEGENGKGEFVTSAVLGRRTESFEYEREQVNYRDFFSSIAAERNEPADTETTPEQRIPKADTDLKSRLYSEGFMMRPYDRGNTSEYYTFNFYQSNRLNRDAWLIVLAVFLVECAVMWAVFAKSISYVYFLPIILGGTALMLIPSFVYLANPTRRKRADFNFKLSLLNRLMLMIEIAVILVLIAFFAVGVSVNDTLLIMMTMVLPVILLTNLPLSSFVYYLLYRGKKYHTA